MRSLVAGNWKMNGLRCDAMERMAKLCTHADKAAALPCAILVCPPATLLGELRRLLQECGIMLGGQDCHAEEQGAFTGNIAAAMLADLGCSHVVVGHSERRRDHGESDALVLRKAAAAHEAGLTAIVCIGESAEDRDAGRQDDVVLAQLAGSLPGDAGSHNTVVAYEPVWAIGTGNTATPHDAASMHALLRAELETRLGADGKAIRLLYGGSVNASNAAELLAVPDIDGALVGGASLDPDEFWSIASCGRAA